jgi:hypothetical protein
MNAMVLVASVYHQKSKRDSPQWAAKMIEALLIRVRTIPKAGKQCREK